MTFKETISAYKWFIIIPIIIIIIGAGNFVGGCFYGQKKVTQPSSGQSQDIKPNKPGKDGDIPPKPTTCDEYKKCAQSEIFTTFTLKKNIATIHAYNSCKFKDDTYKVPVLYFQNTLQFNLGVGMGGYDGKIVPMFGGSIFYIRNFTPSFGFGGGPFYYTSIDRQLWNVGVNLSFEYSW